MSDLTVPRREGMALSERQQEAAVALADLWQTDDKNEMLATYWDYLQSPAARERLVEWADQPDVGRVLQEARELLLPAILHVEGKFAQIERQWPSVFRRVNSKVSRETFAEMKYFGLAQLRPKGAPPVLDGEAGESAFVYHVSPADLALGTRIRRANVEDGSYLSMASPLARGMAESFVQTEEVLHANVFNVGSVYNQSTIGDGNALFSENHPNRPGTYSNVCKYALNEAALEYVATKIRALPDYAGLPLMARTAKLVVPVALQFTAHRLMQALVEEHHEYLCLEGYQVLDYLTDPHAWFVTTSIAGLVSINRKPFRLDFTADGGDLILEGSQSYGMGHYNPRACFASYPSPPDLNEAHAQVDNQMRRLKQASASING